MSANPAPAPQPPAATRRADFLTPTQVADRLLVAPVTVRLWAARGLLPSETTPGGHRRFRAGDVEAFMARRRRIREGASATPSCLLVINDDAQYTRCLRDLLATHAPQLHVDTASDGFTAGIKCESLRPDVVALDLQMPGMDGVEVCRLLRTMSGGAKPRIVVLSGFLPEENSRLLLEAGASACVSKQAPVETLLRALGARTTRNRQAGAKQ